MFSIDHAAGHVDLRRHLHLLVSSAIKLCCEILKYDRTRELLSPCEIVYVH